MQKAVRHLAGQLAGIRTGSISIGFVESVRVDVQGSFAPIRHLGVIKQQGDRILVTPVDKENVPALVRALNDARLNAYDLNPTTMSVSVPPISREQRAEIARHVKRLGEDATVAIRAIRQEARKRIEMTGQGSQRGVQEATDAAFMPSASRGAMTGSRLASPGAADRRLSTSSPTYPVSVSLVASPMNQRDIEIARQESDEVGNPRARGTDGEDVRLLDSHIDRITYVHGLHDLGDKPELVARAASRLVEDGWFAGRHPEPGGVGGDERPGARAVS
jgi:ribosome recycling factor